MSRDNTSSSISLFNSSQVEAITNSPPYLAVYSSLAIPSFSTITKRTLELVALTYALVASANDAGCLHTLDTIIHSSNCTGDIWSSRVDIQRDFTTLCWDSLNEMFCISPSNWSPRISVSHWFLGTFSSSGCSGFGGLTCWWWSMRSISCSKSYCSISVSICLNACPISWSKSWSYDGSPCLIDASCSDESTTYMGVV